MRSTSYFIATMGLVAATIATTIGAQPPGPPPGGRGLGAPGGPGDIERLTILLDLDTYQKGEVERVLKEQRAAFVAEREAAQASGEKPLYQPRTSPDKVREDTLTKARIADVFWGATLAAGLTTAVLYVTTSDPERPSSTAVAVGVTPSGSSVSLRARF